MRDIVFIAIAVGFFALCIAYIALCDRIIGPDPAETEDQPIQTTGVTAS